MPMDSAVSHRRPCRWPTSRNALWYLHVPVELLPTLSLSSSDDTVTYHNGMVFKREVSYDTTVW